MLYANACQIDVTPSLGTVINGEFTCRYASEIADPLYAKAIYLRYENVKILLIVVDICVMKREFLDPIKVEIERLTGILVSNQMISSTHSHSTGSVADLLLAHADLAYRDLLSTRLVELAEIVVENPKPVKVAFGQVSMPEHVTCRRYTMNSSYQPVNPVSGTIDQVKTNPFGAEQKIVGRNSQPDGELCFMGIQTMEGEWLAVLANYGLHYVGDCPRSVISADYFGYFAKAVKKQLGSEDMVVVMSNGTSGEVNIWDFIEGDRYPKEDHAKSEFIANDLALALKRRTENLVWEVAPRLGCSTVDIELRKRCIPAATLEKAKRLVNNTDYELVTYQDEDLYEKVYAREQVLLEAQPDSVLFPIQCLKIGDTLIGALGGEFFAATGLALKEEFPQYFTVTMANDYVGYVPPLREFDFGGYETWRARSSFLEEGAEKRIKVALIELIKKCSHGK
ncbi:hypothetical protein [Sphingobacterium faecale]|uniref:Neutral/alkaline ceramidase-like enzyme n=1 Tax=Sphingobacterium faecale TaxID=2803775 RepID=A0ABS1R3Y0_9SPHI|nr:hypothetical protein [Sphingobacterium faecale]MBL1409414.1 hypothetical protein [Sphingobacterium faecale]